MPTRKHFQQVANVLGQIPDKAVRINATAEFAAVFVEANPRFRQDLFEAAVEEAAAAKD